MSRKRKIIIFASAIVLIAAVVTAILLRPRKAQDGVVEVPLGVEEAVIITTDGSPIEPAPFAWGVAVNVRIASVKAVEGGQVYDVRYIVNRAGDYDLKQYLRFADGKPAEGLPSFRIRGLERLTKDIEARIAETEETGVGLRAWYYETLSLLGIAWLAWLLLLIFARRRRPQAPTPQPAGPSLADQIRGYLAQFESGSLDARQQARLELMIFRQWRRQLAGQGSRSMAESLAAFRADPEVAEAYAELENWLHRARRDGSPAHVAEAVRSRLDKTAEPQATEVTPS